MTREEAIKRLKEARNTIQPFRYVDEVIDYVIKALEQEPCDDCVSRGVFEQVMWERDTAIEQLRELGYELGQKIEPCDDCVSRQAMNDLYDRYHPRLATRVYEFGEELKALPSVTPKREQGEWKMIYRHHNLIGVKESPTLPLIWLDSELKAYRKDLEDVLYGEPNFLSKYEGKWVERENDNAVEVLTKQR